MAPGPGPISTNLQGSFFPEYYVYDGSPDDEDGRVNGEVVYTTYFGMGPYGIPGLGKYIDETLGIPFPANTPDLLYSFEDLPNQNKSTYAPVYLYSFNHLNHETGALEAISPGAMIQVNPGQKLTLNTKMLVDINKFPEVSTGGVAFMEGGGAGSTNMHFHGLNVSPKGYGDNVDIESRSDFSNQIKLPTSHPSGLSWWHPHFHSSANGQVYGGAFGNLQVGDSLNYIPGFENAQRNFIGLKNYNVTYNQQTARFEVRTSQFTPEDTARNIVLVNGEYQPRRDNYHTGDWYSFAFINYASNSFYNIKIIKTKPGVQFEINTPSTWGDSVDLYIYGKDGYQSAEIEQAYTGINNTILNGLQLEDPVGNVVTNLPAPDLENNLFLSPARRYETLAHFQDPGEYKIISEAWTGAGLRAGGWIWPNIELATLVVDGTPKPAPTLLPSQVSPSVPSPNIGLDLAQYEPLRERRITWSGDLFVEGANRYKKINGVIYDTSQMHENGDPNRYAGYGTPFLINDNVLPYNPALIVQLDTLEYWNHENWASEQHPFHPHQNHFQILKTPSGPSNRFVTTTPVADTRNSRSVVELFTAYLGRFPNPQELRDYVAFMDAGNSEASLASILATSSAYKDEFNRFYISESDHTKNPFTQIADGAYYTLTRENIYSTTTTLFWSNKLDELGIEAFPLYMLQQLRSGAQGEAYQARIENLATVGLYAVNKVGEAGSLVTTGTALLRVLNQQVTDNPASVTRLFPIIDNLVNFDPNFLANGEGYYGSLNRMDTVALPAAMIKSQSYSSPSTNRYPAPAAYNEWEPGRITTATTFDNFTGSFLQHCHILPHEDTGQAVIVKIIDNMERSWLSFKKEFAPGENITIYKAATYQPFTLTANPKVSQRIAFGDINKDGYVDIVVGQGDGGSDRIDVYSGINLSLLDSFKAFKNDNISSGIQGIPTTEWNHGVFLDVADVTGDGLSDICIGAGKGGGSNLVVYTDTPSGFQFSGAVTPFQSNPDWADSSQTQFTLGDFDADNFTDFAFLGSQADGSPVEVRSSRDGSVLSLFKPGLDGEIGLSTGYSSYHNLGLETLYMYQKYAPTALVQAATMRAAMYVAHSNMSDNPYYDEAKYYGYASSDEQTLLTKPIGQLSATLGFDWLLADRFSANQLDAASATSQDVLTTYSLPLELDATFAGYYANPILVAARGQSHGLFTYNSQTSLEQLPYFTTDTLYRNAAKKVIELYYAFLQRYPSPAELHRLSKRIAKDGKNAAYIEQVITYSGDYDANNQISVDAVSDQYFNHSTAEITYAYQGITDLQNRSTFRMIGDEYKGVTTLTQEKLANIVTFGLYLDAQLANNMNLNGDLEMYLGYSAKAHALLANSAAPITSDPVSIEAAELLLNAALKGTYSNPLGPSSPLASGLNVESPTYSPMMSTMISPAFGQPIVIPKPIGTSIANAEFLDFTDYPAGKLTVQVDVSSDAYFNNTIGFYLVDNITGQIAGQKPGDAGYAVAAFGRTVLSFGRGQPKSSGSALVTSHTFIDKDSVSGGTLLSVYVISNGTTNDFRSKNPSNARTANGLNTFFTFIPANPDGFDHFRLNGNTFFVEDLWDGGDRDFNDISFKASVIS